MRIDINKRGVLLHKLWEDPGLQWSIMEKIDLEVNLHIKIVEDKDKTQDLDLDQNLQGINLLNIKKE
jgi:hypothetical protein